MGGAEGLFLQTDSLLAAEKNTSPWQQSFSKLQ
jgi:hypothetical protein